MKKNLNVFLVFSILLTSALLIGNDIYADGGPGGPPPSLCNNQIACLTNAFNTAGNQTIQVCAGTPQNLNVSKFNFWYNGTGPLNVSGSGIVSARWANNLTGPAFVIGTSVFNNQSPTDTCVNVVLNASQNAAFTNKTFQINLTANGAAPYIPGTANATMFTINYAALQTGVPNAIFMVFDNSTKRYLSNGPAAADDQGYWAAHCVGIVSGALCLGEGGPAPNNTYMYRGFPPCQMSGSGPNTTCSAVPVNSSQLIYAFDFSSSNTSALSNLTPGTPSIISLNVPVAASFIKPFALKPTTDGPGGPFDFNVNISSFYVQDYGTSNNLFSTQTALDGSFEAPLFLQSGRLYNINISVSSGPYAGVYNFPVMLPYKGFTGLMVVVSNSTDRATIYGKIVNETNANVAGAVVYAQIHKGGGGDGLMLINSSVTDSSGVFVMTIPKTSWTTSCGGNCQQPWPVYQFAIVSNTTNATSGAPMYFQSIDNNGGMGYFAQSDTVYLSKPLVLKSGGQANVNVTLNGATSLVSELAKTLPLPRGVIKHALTAKYNMLS
ncbi:Uncharacterised protein [uncultured archaeon]|nr:Uncharacterised protein [uncultured archaeon]